MTERVLYLLHFDGSFADEVAGNTWVPGPSFGAVTSTAQKKYGTASLRYDANADFNWNLASSSANLGGSDAWSTSSWCADAYIYFTGSTASKRVPVLCNIRFAGGGQVGVQYYQNNLACAHYTNAGYSNDIYVAVAPFSINTWYHIRWSCDGANTYLFVNGTLIDTSAVFGSPTMTGPATGATMYTTISPGPHAELMYVDECRFIIDSAVTTTTFPPLIDPFPAPGPPPPAAAFWTNFVRSYEVI